MSMLNRILVISVALLFSPAIGRAEDHAIASSRFKLGVIVPLSGDQQSVGKAHRVVEAFVREAEAELDQTIEILYEDSLSTSAGALGAFNKLVEVDRVGAVYAVGADLLPLLAPFAEERRVPFFAPEGDISQAVGKHYTTLFRNDYSEVVRALWEQLRIEKKKKIAVFKNKAPGMNALVRALSENIMGGESVTVLADEAATVTSFRKQLAGLKKEKFDILGLFLLPVSYRALMAELASAGIKLPILGDETLLTGGLAAGSERLLESALVATEYVTPEFRERFKVATGSDLHVEYAGMFYQFLALLNEEVHHRGGAFENSDEFLKAMRFQNERRRIFGPIGVKMTASGATYFSLPVAIYRIIGGAPTVQRLFERPR